MNTVVLIVVLIAVFGIILLIVRQRYAKKLKLALKRAQKSAQLKSVFIENISRSLSAPLDAISEVSSSILEEKDENMLPDQVRKKVTDISDASKELVDFVAQLREMSKFEGNNPLFTYIEVNLSELMASYQREAMHHTKPDVKVRISTDLSPHCRVILDTNLMHQLMMHLLTNAANRVTQGDIFIKYNCERRGLKVSITYIDYEKFEHEKADIYTHLEKEDALKEAGKSSVLGLAICKAIVDMVSGEFFMGSEDGKTSVASFWFPCKMKNVYKDL